MMLVRLTAVNNELGFYLFSFILVFILLFFILDLDKECDVISHKSQDGHICHIHKSHDHPIQRRI